MIACVCGGLLEIIVIYLLSILTSVLSIMIWKKNEKCCDHECKKPIKAKVEECYKDS